MKLALGSVLFGQNYGLAAPMRRVQQSEVNDILSEAAGHCVDVVDTAIEYGASEEVLGRAGVAGWRIITKLPAVPASSNDIESWVFSKIRGSLARLRVDRLAGLLLHRPDQIFSPFGDAILKSLLRLKEEGLVEKIGVSIYSPDDLGPILERVQIDLVQAPLSILDRRLVVSGWARELRRRGVEVHGRSVFLQGLLLLNGAKRPQRFQRWNGIWDEWERYLAAERMTPLEACLRYALSVEEVDKVIIGIGSAAQLREILASAHGEIRRLPEWVDEVDLDLIEPSRWEEK
jgi:hypothetical protein